MVAYKIGKKSNKMKLLHINMLNRMHKLSLKSLDTQIHIIENFGFNIKDIRVTFFGRIATVLDSRRVSYMMISDFQNKKLSQKKYRNKVFDSKIPIYGDLDTVYSNSMGDLKRGFFLDIFQTFESTLRQLNISLGNDNIPALYKILNNYILPSTGLSNDQQNRARELLVFISLLRNSVHNNGIYFPVHGGYNITFPINYKGNSYTYSRNDKILLNFELLLGVTEDVIEVLEYIIKDNNLNSHVVNSSPFRAIFIEDKTL
ncbi:hypothetical protein ACFOUV_13230 [Oceanobacillus longus]|uniref:Uncharacterized protein n=1 Tax=Oceanobacillus longus TaxID=930120 RepID=A0ABV8H1P6_9BACI